MIRKSENQHGLAPRTADTSNFKGPDFTSKVEKVEADLETDSNLLNSGELQTHDFLPNVVAVMNFGNYSFLICIC